MNIHFKLLDKKIDKKGYAPIYLVAYYSGKNLRYFTKIKAKPNHFNNKKEEFRGSMPEYEVYNLLLASIKSKLHKYYFEYLEEYGYCPSKDELKRCLSFVKGENKTIIILIEEFLEYAEKYRAKNTVKNYRTFKNHFQLFEKKKKSQFTLLDLDFKQIYAFEYYLIEHGLSDNGVFSVMKSFKAFVQYCHKYQDVVIHKDLYNIKSRYTEKEKMFLTEDQLKQVESVELKAVNLRKVRDCFLFMCYTGISYVDGFNMKPENLIESGDYNVLKFKRKKTINTNHFHTEVALGEKTMAIINRYRGGELLLPFISNQKMNDLLKRVATKAGLKNARQVTTHTARHTYASLSLMRNLRPEVIASNMGLSSTEKLKVYMKMTDTFKHEETLGVWD